MTVRLTSACLRLAGALILLIGVGHIFMPQWGYAASATAGMTETARAHFYFLGTYAICVFLLAFGVLSLVHARRPDQPGTLAFAVVMGAVWCVRVWLEFAYPVRLKIFVLEDPHPVLVPVLVTIAACFLVAAWGGWRMRMPRLARQQG